MPTSATTITSGCGQRTARAIAPAPSTSVCSSARVASQVSMRLSSRTSAGDKRVALTWNSSPGRAVVVAIVDLGDGGERLLEQAHQLLALARAERGEALGLGLHQRIEERLAF